MIRLKEKGIETRPLFPPIHTQPIYCSNNVFPVAENLAANGLSLPSSVGMRPEDVERVVEAIDSLH